MLDGFLPFSIFRMLTRDFLFLKRVFSQPKNGDFNPGQN